MSKIRYSRIRPITIHDMLSEMQTWVTISDEKLEEAKQSKLNNKNNTQLNELVNAWNSGSYDEDPELMVQKILNLLNNYY